MDRSSLYADCALATRFFTEHVPDGTCRGCKAELGARRRVWCSNRCSSRWWTVFAREHDWNDARRRAIKRDKRRCVLCGGDGTPPPALLAEHVRAHEGTLGVLTAVRAMPAKDRKRGERTAALVAHKEASRALKSLVHRYRLEVDHIEPRRGGGYGTGCWNHLANLRTLCHADHVAITNKKRELRSDALRA